MTTIHTAANRLEFIQSSVMLGQLLAILLSLAAIGVRLLIGDALTGFPFLTFFPAITLAAFLGGRMAGITAAILGGLLAQYYLIEPINSFAETGAAGWIALGFYALTATIIIVLMNAMFAAFDRQRDSENRLQMALSAGGGVGAWDLDIASGLVTANEQFARLYGVDVARARDGAPLAEFFGHIHGDYSARVQAAVEKAIATGTELREDYRLVQADGTLRWVLAVGRCVYDADNTPSRFPGVSFDITSRKATEEKLRLLNADLERQVVERSSERGTTWQLSPHLLSVINLETGCFSRVNPGWTAAMGWSEDELVGKPFYDFFHPDDRDMTQEAWEHVQGGEAALNFENRYLTKHGETRVLSWVAVPEHGFLYCTARDVTADRALKDSEA